MFFKQKIYQNQLFEFIYSDLQIKYLRIYRWNPSITLIPWFSIYPINFYQNQGLMFLDILISIKNFYDSSLTFRRSCREGICGSCSMNIDGMNSLACLKPLDFGNKNFITIYPLPHFFIIKDLVSDLANFYNQYKAIQPWLIFKNTDTSNFEHLQAKKDRIELDGLYECILCACCSSSCPSYWWSFDKYLGPAILLQAYRWILDSRDMNKVRRYNFLNNKFRILKCHTILNCSKVCPKKLDPAKAISKLKLTLLQGGES